MNMVFQNREDHYFGKCYTKLILANIILILYCTNQSNAGFACLSNPCIFGICIDGLNSSYSCYCIDGYTGIQCQTNWDECWSMPCQNGGTCIDGVASYNCSCADGFTGLNCDRNIDECLSSPCLNGGLCIDKHNSYMCDCLPGYYGTHCEQDIAVCDTGENRCFNGGKCLDGPGLDFYCSCLAGWNGRFCEKEINECDSNPCHNGGICVDKLNSYLCACPMGYAGNECEEEIQLCETNPCENNALCLIEEGVPTCYCVPDFHGSKCEYQYDECLLNPKCMNGGLCIDGVDSFWCSCPPPMTGLLCECYISDYNLDCGGQYSSVSMVSQFSTISTVLDHHFIYNKTLAPDISSEEIETSTDDNSYQITLPTDEQPVEISVQTMFPLESEPPTTEAISKQSSEEYYTNSESLEYYDLYTPIETTEYELLEETTAKYKPSEKTLLSETTTSDVSHIQSQTAPAIQNTSTSTQTVIDVFTTAQNSYELIPHDIEILDKTSTVANIITEFITKSYEIFNTSFNIVETTPILTITSKPLQVYTPTPEPVSQTIQNISTTSEFPITTTATTLKKVTTTPTTTNNKVTTTPTTTIINQYFNTIPPEIVNTIFDCNKYSCANGGTCITYVDGSKCVCKFNFEGPNCENEILIKHAAFMGESYATHHLSDDKQLQIQVRLKLFTRDKNGMIFLASAYGTNGGHYMALYVQNGLLQFQFSCGLQTMLLSELETSISNGHEVRISAELKFSKNFTHCNASLLVNDTLAMSGDQPTWWKYLPENVELKDIAINSKIHFGGAPDIPLGLIIELPFSYRGSGFVGCIHSVFINDVERHIFSDAEEVYGITECELSSCISSPCRNGADCIKTDSYNGTNDWYCKCTSGFTGTTCEISVCDNNPCNFGATCVQFPGSGYLCLCPLGKHGHFCEHNLEVTSPSFSGSINGLSSYLAYTVPVPLENSIELSFKILPQTMSQISLLAFLGQSNFHNDKSDHLAVSFIQGYIMLTWNLGNGARRIFTQKAIDFRLESPRVPYEIKIGRLGKEAWLSVDDKYNVSGKSAGTKTKMDVVPILFIGGHDSHSFNTLPHDLPLHSGFQGCIYDLRIKSGGVTVPLQETREMRGRGVGQCGTRECHRHACQNGGACLQHGSTFTCICQEGWYGPLCSLSKNPCQYLNNKCSEESVCVPLVNGYECDCPLGKTGKYCDIDITSLSDIFMNGKRSYITIDWPSISDDIVKRKSPKLLVNNTYRFNKNPISMKENQHFVLKLLREFDKQRQNFPISYVSSNNIEYYKLQYFYIEMQVRPLSEKGLIFYYGSANMNEENNSGFICLSLQGGVVEFRISVLSKTGFTQITVVRSVRMLAIGEWHKVKVAKRGRWITLWVEGSASTSLSTAAEIMIAKHSIVHIGGLKDLSKLPPKAISGYPINFRGCIRGLSINGNRIVLNYTNIRESVNIRDCDGTPCGGDSCEYGGHCWLDVKLKPHCICPDSASGERCEILESCHFISCKNNGKCMRNGKCSCPNGWSGFYCEFAFSKPNIPSFNGNSYLILPTQKHNFKDKRGENNVTYDKNKDNFEITLNFSTINKEGMLFWTEKHKMIYVGAGFENGLIKIVNNLLQNNSVLINSEQSYIDGAWHVLNIQLNKYFLKIILDNSQTIIEHFNESSELISNGNRIFIGGFPNDVSTEMSTNFHFQNAFHGCINAIRLGNRMEYIHDFSVYEGENIGSCHYEF